MFNVAGAVSSVWSPDPLWRLLAFPSHVMCEILRVPSAAVGPWGGVISEAKESLNILALNPWESWLQPGADPTLDLALGI